jgi:hypothetical protein
MLGKLSIKAMPALTPVLGSAATFIKVASCTGLIFREDNSSSQLCFVFRVVLCLLASYCHRCASKESLTKYSFTVLTEVSQLTIEFFMSVTVGGDAGLRTRGTAIFAAAAAGGFTAVRVDVVAENTASAKSKQMMIENCILGQGE